MFDITTIIRSIRESNLINSVKIDETQSCLLPYLTDNMIHLNDEDNLIKKNKTPNLSKDVLSFADMLSGMDYDYDEFPPVMPVISRD